MGRTVLIVDDDPVIRGLLSTLLSLDGIDCEDASNGREAIDAIERRRPDLIVLDLMMPVMDGWRFLSERSMRNSLGSIPVIVMTAARYAEESLAGYDLAGVCQKPFDIEEMVKLVLRTIDQPPGPC
jgi:two-component system chemotaxis response regulator CheY